MLRGTRYLLPKSGGASRTDKTGAPSCRSPSPESCRICIACIIGECEENTMTEQERQFVVDQLAAGRERLLELVDGLTAEQWTFRPSEDRWSIAECMEHVTLVENRVLGLI